MPRHRRCAVIAFTPISMEFESSYTRSGAIWSRAMTDIHAAKGYRALTVVTKDSDPIS